MTVYNSSKQRLESIDAGLTNENTTWFDDVTNSEDVQTITDMNGGLLITQWNYNYPIWIDGVSRDDINYCKRKAKDFIVSLKSSTREK
jgi:hypothetical protein